MKVFRPIHAVYLAIALLYILGAARVAGAQGKKDIRPVEAPTSDAQRIEEPWRPSADKVSKAEAALSKLTPEQLALANALRILANRPDDSAQAAPLNRLSGASALGSGGASLAAAPEYALRLAALLRAGLPAVDALVAETASYLNSPRSAQPGQFSEVLLDLLVCDAVCAREEREFATLQAKASTRAKEACALLSWTSKEPSSAPSAEQLCNLACEALCRRYAARRGWAVNLPTGWAEVVESLCKRLRSKGRLWPEAVSFTEKNSTPALSALWMGALLSMTRFETCIDVTKGSFAGSYTAACRAVTRSVTDTRQAWASGMDLDGAALFALFPKELEPDSCKPLQGHLRKKSLSYFSAVDFKSAGLGVAAATGWLIEPSWNLPESMREQYLPPGSLDDKHYVAQLSLNLLGFCGGISPAEKCTVIGTPEEFNTWASALAVLDAHKIPRLQDKIAHAITQAANWLKDQQRPDGTFYGNYSARLGGHCLNMLALLDSGMSREDPCIQKALRALPIMDAGKLATGQLDGPVYSYAVALLFFQKYYEKEQGTAKVLEASSAEDYKKATAKVWRGVRPEHRDMITKMVAVLTKEDHSFGWSYFAPATQDGTSEDITGAAYRDNSNSQYAVMGLKSASLLGAPFDRAILAGEAKRLIRCYKPDSAYPAIRVRLTGENDERRTGTDGSATIVPGGWDYTSATTAPADSATQPGTASAMTAAGISSLVICRDELRLSGLLDARLKSDIDLHIHGALHWVGSKFSYRYVRGQSSMRIYAEGWGKYYDLYSIERAGVLSNVRKMADVEWYAEGATLLVETQQGDGAWPDIAGMKPIGENKGPDTVDHCFAILFLKRAVVPVTRRPVITQED
ncbi:hypothetical protein PLCT2_02587 [Planctomycetaceae bacterium]|nr:hypothetical protein PLCT2_02587 [Planctomycetaceae bacterium]